MPLYEYQCRKCGEVFEKMQKFSDAPLSQHEGCGGEVERLISPSAFHLKGSGWYATDYGKKNGSSGKTETKSETRTESKSEAKTEAPAASTNAKKD